MAGRVHQLDYVVPGLRFDDAKWFSLPGMEKERPHEIGQEFITKI